MHCERQTAPSENKAFIRGKNLFFEPCDESRNQKVKMPAGAAGGPVVGNATKPTTA
jgi:hypothetical protein